MISFTNFYILILFNLILQQILNPVSCISTQVLPRSISTSHSTTTSDKTRKIKKRCLPKNKSSGAGGGGGGGDYGTGQSNAGPLSQTHSGQGTHNNEDWPGGNCAFTKWPQPSGFGAIAISSNVWNSSQICGACLEISGPGGTFKGIVENQCPSCKNDGLDLDTDIWSKVSGGQPPGQIQLTWKIIACGFSKPINFMNKSGTSKDWTSIQVQGSNTPVTSLEVSTNGGNSWVNLVRKSESNYFQDPGNKGLGSTGDIRVTCSTGKKFVTKNVDLATPDTPTQGSSNC